MILQIATALAIGVYVVLSRDLPPKSPDAVLPESSSRPVDHLDHALPLNQELRAKTANDHLNCAQTLPASRYCLMTSIRPLPSK
jgi:hypothetical protein